MHDIWNPWHGCVKISEGCQHCYMYFLDKVRGKNGADIYRTQSGFTYPLHKNKNGQYKIKSGELIRVCMSSDFFLEEADEWRKEAWAIMKQRCDVKFFLLTKRPQRVAGCLPQNWDKGWENIFFNVTCENQKQADERIPVLLNLPFKHKGIMTAPLIGPVSLEKYLVTGQIEQVIAGGENYDGARPCNFDWVKQLRNECEKYNVTFCFIETGTNFVKDGKNYRIPKKIVQSQMAHKSAITYRGKPIDFKLTDNMGLLLNKEILYCPKYKPHCDMCGSKLICNGCSNCRKCIS